MGPFLSQDVFGIPVVIQDSLDQSVESTLRLIRESDRQGPSHHFAFLSLHGVAESQESSDLLNVLKGAQACFPDGRPLAWFASFKSRRHAARICGPDFMKAFLLKSSDLHHGFIGGSASQIASVVNQYQLKSWIHYEPPFRNFSEKNTEEDWSYLKAQSPEQLPHCVWVALGAPKQDFWSEAAARKSHGVAFFAVGAALDFLSGQKERAPIFMQKTGLEWLYRLSCEPRRLWRRYLGIVITLTKNFYKI